MILFLDTSTIVAACGSEKGLSRWIFTLAQEEPWQLVTAAYCFDEIERNVGKLPGAIQTWNSLIKKRLSIVPSELVLDRPIIFEKTKDRPVIFSAIGADAVYLITSDTTDFGHVLGTSVYGVKIRTPRGFLLELGFIETI